MRIRSSASQTLRPPVQPGAYANFIQSPPGKRFARCIALSIALILLAAHCSEDSPVRDPESVHRDPGKFAGTYSLEPAMTRHYIVLKEDGTAISERDGHREIGFVQRDSRMLRIYLQKKPVGLFLLDDYDAKDWRGVWKDSVRILKRIQ